MTSSLFLIARIYSTTNLKTYEQAKKKKKERKIINPPNTHLKSPLRKKIKMQILHLCLRLSRRIRNPLKYLK